MWMMCILKQFVRSWDILILFQDIVVGDACADLRNQLDISYPVNNGIVQNWDDMGHVWDHAFYNELKVNVP